jgi:hypothetical protein
MAPSGNSSNPDRMPLQISLALSVILLGGTGAFAQTLVIVQDHVRCGFARCKLGAHLLDL